ncbi:MAG: hypothetical protein ABJP66_20705 [Hyphomicrobiales bacterium]
MPESANGERVATGERQRLPCQDAGITPAHLAERTIRRDDKPLTRRFQRAAYGFIAEDGGAGVRRSAFEPKNPRPRAIQSTRRALHNRIARISSWPDFYSGGGDPVRNFLALAQKKREAIRRR